MTNEWWYWNIVSRLWENSFSMTISLEDTCNLFDFLEKTSVLDGDVAEVGVAEGGSAAVICEAKKGKVAHFFDTFTGLPKPTKEDEGSAFAKGQFATDYKKVKKFLKRYPDVFLYKGTFPKTAEPIKDKMFSFVHLDADLYKSTKEALEFFWPRMSPGGVIISHDYQTEKGVKKAFADALLGIETQKIGRSQGFVIKI